MGRGTSKVSGKSSGSLASRPIADQVNDFINELNDRQYGSGTKQIPPKQQEEYRAVKREIKKYVDDYEGTIIPASGFANSDDYIHTTTKLNAYQRMVKSDARNIRIDLQLGVINESQATKELKVLKSVDATIKRRRELLNRY